MGGNPAENHPCGFKWAVEAKRNRNAKMIVVDPRFTRTASAGRPFPADSCRHRYRLSRRPDQLRARQRPRREGISRQLHQCCLSHQGRFQAAGRRAVFSGFDDETKTYDKATWNYQAGGNETGKVAARSPATRNRPGPHAARDRSVGTGSAAAATASTPLPPNIAYDLSLQHPQCVYQLLKQQYSRYTPEMVERITGIPKDQLSEGRRPVHVHPQRWRHEEGCHHHLCRGLDPHSFGTQIIRTAAMLQLLHGQRRSRRRRCERAARALEYPGRNRHGRHLRHSARLLKMPSPAERI